MKTNIKALEEKLQKAFAEMTDVDITITSNKKKIKQGQVAVEVAATTTVNDENTSENVTATVVTVVMFIVEKDRKTRDGEENTPTPVSVLIVNKRSNDIIFNNFGVAAVDKSMKYLQQYVERSISYSKNEYADTVTETEE